ncbi:hypothetical protein [Echinococcus multilocularis]|uniref:Uncharacterized protein n=1 Tax=Echinococcus multilocularis TaxID=6211 RepID=A0A0S4MMI3_ECHMU|nr:hypothetical protein [Echinococcus multilocularis]
MSSCHRHPSSLIVYLIFFQFSSLHHSRALSSHVPQSQTRSLTAIAQEPNSLQNRLISLQTPISSLKYHSPLHICICSSTAIYFPSLCKLGLRNLSSLTHFLSRPPFLSKTLSAGFLTSPSSIYPPTCAKRKEDEVAR